MFNKNMKGKDRKYYTVKELADILGISRVAVFNKVKKGEIKAEKAGRNYIIYQQDLGSFFAEDLTEKLKGEIKEGVAKAIKDYEGVLRKLGDE